MFSKRNCCGIFILLFLINIAVDAQSQLQVKDSVSRPTNIIFIMIDDLGYGDVGAYNDDINFTPNIDRLAAGGMRFTDFHSNGAMCTPTRAALLTGMYQQRLGARFEYALSAKRDDKGMPLETLTIAELLRKQGYATAIYGKWHLGYEVPYIPTNYGFDEFRGLLSGDGDHFTHINRWGRKDWWLNDQLSMEKGYSTDLITKHSTQFIEQHKKEPFFLYVPYLNIHFPWQGPDDLPHRQAGKYYENDKWGIIKNENNVRPHVRSMIKAVDQSLGKIIKKLEELRLERKTLVIFTSDNGGYTHYYQNQHKFENISDNGILRGQKTQVYEGGHRVPFIAYWPGTIKAGTETSETVMTMDMYPTFVELAGVKIPKEKEIDGISILPVLFNKNMTLHDRTLFWKIGDEWAVRKGPWKLVKNKGRKALFNLEKDISESVDLSLEYPERIKEFTQKFQNWKRTIATFAEKK